MSKNQHIFLVTQEPETTIETCLRAAYEQGARLGRANVKIEDLERMNAELVDAAKAVRSSGYRLKDHHLATIDRQKKAIKELRQEVANLEARLGLLADDS